MSSSDYQGSQAFANNTQGTESVNRNTGSVSFTKTLVSLIGIHENAGLHLSLRYSSGTSGTFGLPNNWTFDIPWIVPGQSLTIDGRTYVIDYHWADSAGYQSGLRYVNNHGIKLTPQGPPQPLPSGQPGMYEWAYRRGDGMTLYFDGTGKLLEQDDLWGNYIYYTYTHGELPPTRSGSNTVSALLRTIQDSWGQKVLFGYQGSLIQLQSPDGNLTQIQFDATGVRTIKDPLGNMTTFTNVRFGTSYVIDTIQYPGNHVARFTYQQMAYLDSNGTTQHFPGVKEHVNLQGASIVSRTGYEFGSESGSRTFTGYGAGYRLGLTHDTLIDSNNQDYLYDVLVSNLSPSNEVLSTSRVFFNSLHLPVQEIHYTLPQGRLVASYQSIYSYVLDSNDHARSTNYALPATTEQFHLDTSGNRQPLRRSTATYDSFGSQLTNAEEMWDKSTSAYVSLSKTTSTYLTTQWNLQMPQTEEFYDQKSGRRRMLTYSLTQDQKSVAQTSTRYMDLGDDYWNSWKDKSFSWDSNGRKVSETLAWSDGVQIPPGTVSSFTRTTSYAFDAVQGHYTTTDTDPQGKSTLSVQSTKIWQGPVVRKQLAMGETELFEFDAMGRVTRYTDPLGKVATTSYVLTPSEISMTTTNSMGYVTKRYYDGRGNALQVCDNGDPTQPISPSPTRVLSAVDYDSLSRAISKTDELGLVTKIGYDALNRITSTTDPLGNVTLTDHDDTMLTQKTSINGSLRTVAEKDPLGRNVRTTNYADTGDNNIDYCLVHESDFSGYGQELSAKSYRQSLSNNGTQTLLFESQSKFNAEFGVSKEVHRGVASDMVSFDTVQRIFQHDLFGNVYSYTKDITYSDGKSYNWKAPERIYDSCNRYISYTNQIGQQEKYAYDAGGFMTQMTRFDGSTVSYSRDAIGRVTAISGAGESVTRAYQDNGRISQIQSQTSSGTQKTEYQYSLDGAAKAVVNNDGTSQSYVLDKTSRITKALDALGFEQLNTFDDTTGQVSNRSHGTDNLTYAYGTVNHTNGMLVGDTITGSSPLNREVSYDGFGRVVRNTIRRPGTSQIVLDNAYLYNSQNKVVMVQVASEAFPNNESLNYTRSFEYDGLSQLRKDTTKFATTGRVQTKTFLFDGNSNVIETSTDESVTQMSYNAIDQRTDPGFSWDTNGRMLTDNAGRKYDYHANDRLSNVSGQQKTSTFGYDARGAIALRTVGETKNEYFHDMGSVSSVRTNSGGVTSSKSYFQEPGRRIAAYGETATPSYLLETLGSTSLTLEGPTGQASDYGAYGNAESVGASNSPAFGYRQELTDDNSGLIYLRSRFYHPSCQSFLTMDTNQLENRYTYCAGDPINSADRTGQSAEGIIAGAVVGTVVTIGLGIATGGIGAVIFGPECIAASIAAGATAGAVGNLAGDYTRAKVDKEDFTVVQGLEDVVSGAVGGAAGTAAGSFAGSRAMAACLARGMSQRAITVVGSVTSGSLGGMAGGFSGTVSEDLMTGQPVFSEETALSTVTGALGGVGGGLLGSMAYLGIAKSCVIPVPLKQADLHLIMPAVEPDNIYLAGRRLYVMAPQVEAEGTFAGYQQMEMTERDALRLKKGGRTYDTIAAHGAGKTMFVSVEYGTATGRPNYMRPVRGSLFAQHMVSEGWGGGGDKIKFISCFSGFSNAQELATALQRDVWGSYELVNRYSMNTKWVKFRA